jgi:alkylation response protein AidB-like acyl-CoA dehydrogenase
MDFNLSDDQVTLAQVASQLFAKNSGVEFAREALDRDVLYPVNTDLIALGALELLTDETRGGGGTVLDLAVVVEQAGRYLTPTRLVSFGGRVVTVLESAASSEALAVLERALTGEATVTVADAPLDSDQLILDEDGLLFGRTGAVLDAVGATDVVVLATSASGPVLAAVDLAVAGDTVRRVQPKPLDATRGLQVLEFNRAHTVSLASGAAALSAWERGRDVARVLLAAEDLGTATEANRMARDYALQRHTFGRRIASFQAVKHALVDSYVGEEQLRSLVWLAAWAADADVENLPLYAAATAAYAADVVEQATRTLIHTHGGIGFTWEHDAHLYWRRARADRALFGDTFAHRRAVATLTLGKETCE